MQGVSHQYSVPVPPLTSVFTGTSVFRIDDTRFPGPFTTSISLSPTFDGSRRVVSIGPFTPIIIGPITTPIGSDMITITLVGGGLGSFNRASGAMLMPVTLHFDHGLPDFAVGDSDVDFNLTTSCLDITKRDINSCRRSSKSCNELDHSGGSFSI